VSKAQEQHIDFGRWRFREAEVRLSEKILMHAGQGFSGIAFTMDTGNIHEGVVDQDAEQFPACVSGTACDACAYLFHVGRKVFEASGFF
jgi:hypothetical protein